MDITHFTDPAEIVNARASAEGWPTRCTSVLEFEQSGLNAVVAIWRDKAKGRPAPYRRELDARVLKPVLRRITIAERVNDGGRSRFRLRLIGSDIVSLFGDHTGGWLDDAVPPALLPRWYAPYDAVLDTCRPMRIASAYDHPRVDYLAGENLLAPLLDAEGRPTMLLTASYFHSRADARPTQDPVRHAQAT